MRKLLSLSMGPDQKSLKAKNMASIDRLIAIADRVRECYGSRKELRIQMFMPMSALGMLLLHDKYIEVDCKK